MAIDIFDVDEMNSVLRQRVREGREINLKDFNIPVYELGPDYAVEKFSFSLKGIFIYGKSGQR